MVVAGSRERRATPRADLVAVAVAVVLFALVTAACSGSSGSDRPSTRASLEIVSPPPNSETGPDVPVEMRLDGARVVRSSQIGGALRSDRGHVHLSIDGTLVSMPYTLDQTVTGLATGSHTIEAEFVAVDHQPFANRVVAAVTFTVR